MSNLNKYDTDKWLFYINQTKNSTTLLDNGDYTYQAFAGDESGHTNQTDLRYITIGVPPQIAFTPPTPNNATSQEFRLLCNYRMSKANR